jgi:RimJ/RimL family protein N-acetyltransferase
VLETLVRTAVTDASPNEVTPPLTPGGEWSPERIEWLRNFHRDRRSGLDGPAGEATWAVLADAELVGSVRLARTAEPDVLEVGIWLARGARGRGLARRALAVVLAEAAGRGARMVRADTTSGNRAALAVLSRMGFELSAGQGDAVTARITPQRPPAVPPGQRRHRGE